MMRSKQKQSLARKKILLVVTGSIAAYKIADAIQLLRDHGAGVTCVLTESAKHFVTPLVLRAVSGNKVYHDFFSEDTPYDVLHTSLAEETDLVLVAPASADFIAKAACGLADDLASCILLATPKPVLIAPAMNDRMYAHVLTQKNIRILKEAGYKFIAPIQGHLVCGKEAVGHIAEPESIVKAVEALL